MTNNDPKTHLRERARDTAACGAKRPPRMTKDPAKVTCGGCKRTLAMADAEVMARRRSVD